MVDYVEVPVCIFRGADPFRGGHLAGYARDLSNEGKARWQVVVIWQDGRPVVRAYSLSLEEARRALELFVREVDTLPSK